MSATKTAPTPASANTADDILHAFCVECVPDEPAPFAAAICGTKKEDWGEATNIGDPCVVCWGITVCEKCGIHFAGWQA